MPGSYTQLLFHVVFATKGRQAWITPEVAERLYPFLGGIVRAEDGVLHAIGGMPDHVHLFLQWRADSALADLMRQVKSRSSRWVHLTYPELAEFAWQEGYSAFTVSKSREPNVKRYIANQAAHHAKEDFRTELARLLSAHGVAFDERFAFE